MKSWKILLVLVLGGVLCIISASCSSSSRPPLPTQLEISTVSLAAATQNADYSAPLVATGGTSPYTWSLLSGTLPPGLTLSSGGIIAGTPTVAGTFTFTVGVADSSPTPATASVQLSLTIAGKVTITTSSLPAGSVDVAYSATLSAVGGVTPYTWTLASGSLPAGLTLSSAGAISGTPTTAGSSTFTVEVADSEPTPSTASAQLSITINNSGNTASFRGRMGIYEVLSLSPEMQKLITKTGTSSETLQDQAMREGMVTMQTDGFIKALRGQTTLEEVMRVTTDR